MGRPDYLSATELKAILKAVGSETRRQGWTDADAAALCRGTQKMREQIAHRQDHARPPVKAGSC